MAHGLESRVPLRRPRGRRVRRDAAGGREVQDGELKHALKQPRSATSCRRAILERKDKMGFPVPLGEWMQGELRDFVLDMLRPTRRAQRPYLDPRFDIELLIAREGKFSRNLWGLLRSSSGSRSSTTARPSGGSRRTPRPSWRRDRTGRDRPAERGLLERALRLGARALARHHRERARRARSASTRTTSASTRTSRATSTASTSRAGTCSRSGSATEPSASTSPSAAPSTTVSTSHRRPSR